jgi:hypothetical protein
VAGYLDTDEDVPSYLTLVLEEIAPAERVRFAATLARAACSFL